MSLLAVVWCTAAAALSLKLLHRSLTSAGASDSVYDIHCPYGNYSLHKTCPIWMGTVVYDILGPDRNYSLLVVGSRLRFEIDDYRGAEHSLTLYWDFRTT